MILSTNIHQRSTTNRDKVCAALLDLRLVLKKDKFRISGDHVVEFGKKLEDDLNNKRYEHVAFKVSPNKWLIDMNGRTRKLNLSETLLS